MRKRIAIIGAGVAGLRGAMEFLDETDHDVCIFDKSRSVGGRVATRRFGQGYVNHGAPKFSHWERVLEQDQVAATFSPLMTPQGEFLKEATALPKAMKEYLLSKGKEIEFHFESKVTKVSKSQDKIEVTYVCNGEEKKLSYDGVLITAPVPQAEEMMGFSIEEEVLYHKKILMIGFDHLKKTPVRMELDHETSESIFDLKEDEMLSQVQEKLQRSLVGFDIKKWRYSQVKKGVPLHFHHVDRGILLAGEAFDIDKKFDLSSAWISGREAARTLKELL